MKAVILAAGEGARMGPFTASEPKVMLPVANRPILEHVLRALAASGVDEAVLVVGYHRERIQSHFQDGRSVGVRLEYAVQAKQLGTAHALHAALDGLDGPFLVVNGSNVLDARAVRDLLDAPGPPAVLVAETEVPEKYGVVRLRENAVEAIVEKPRERIGNLIAAGAYLLDGSVRAVVEAHVQAGRYDLPDVVNDLAARGTVHAVRTEGTWIDALYPWDLLRVNAAVLGGIAAERAGTIEAGVTLQGPVVLGAGCRLRSGTYVQGPVVLGRGCEVGPHAVLLPSTSVGDNVRVHPFTLIENSVVMDDASVGPGSTLTHAVVGKGVRIGPGFAAPGGPAELAVEGELHRVDPLGVLVGEDAVIGSGGTAAPGTMVGARCRIGDRAALRGVLPDGSLVM